MSTENFEDHRWDTTPQKREFRHSTAVELTPAGTVLDVGCGDGLLLEMYSEKAIEVEGVDISNTAVEICTRKGFTVKKCDFTESPLPYPDNSFDTVVALDVLEHVYNPEQLLREMRRVTKNSIIISVPNFASLPARVQVMVGRVPENNTPNKGHLYWFTWKVLSNLLLEENLTIVEKRFNTFWKKVPILGNIIEMLVTHYPSMFALSFVVRCKKI